MASTTCKIEDFIAESENYHAAYPNNGTFPFTAGVYNSVFYKGRVVLVVSVKALATHDWVALRSQLEVGLPSIIFVMFNTVTEAEGANNEATML
jgi:hypothetical protein